MNLAQAIRRQLAPALKRSQGFWGTYTRGTQTASLVAIPTLPDWISEDDRAVIEEYAALTFIVFCDDWAATGLGLPQQSDRLSITLADGVPRIYALLGEKGKRPYAMAENSAHYLLRMKWVKG